jgi:biopolymer transport protein ExbD
MKLDAGIARRRARVEMIPLIDCVFILLVFFIYSMLAMTMRRGLVVQLPGAATAQTDREDATVLTITAEGALLLNDDPVTLDGLSGAVRAMGLASQSTRFVINADRRAEHGWVVRALDELQTMGVTRVSILSEERGRP